MNNKTCGGIWVWAMIVVALLLGSCAQTSSNSEDEAVRWAEATLQNLTLEKRVAQLICTDISGIYLSEDDPKFQQWLKLAGDHGVGGFVLYGGTPRDVALLVNRLQQEATVPLLVSADFEGGPGQQVTGASEFPSNMAFAATGDEELMYRAAKIMAGEGLAMGIHLTYTPVSDLSIDPDNPQESVRSFGGDIGLIGRLLNAYVKGYHEVGMLTTAKHFPGRGNMRALVNFSGFNYLREPAAQLNQHEFKAFQLAIDAGVDFIMTEHIAVPMVADGSMLPASVEPKLVKGVIRDQLGFKGIITTDDLWYDHVTNRFGTEEVALKALEAGHDIVLKPKDPVATIKAIVDAVKSGRIPEEQINQSVMKLLVHKANLGLHQSKLVDVSRVGQVVGTVAHHAVIQEVADRSVTLIKNEGVLPRKEWDPKKTVHIILQKEEIQPTVRDLTMKMTAAFEGLTTFVLKPDLNTSIYETVKKRTKEADLILLSFMIQRTRHGDSAPIREEDLILIQEIIRDKPGNVMGMSFGNPHLIRKIPAIPCFLIGYGETGWYGNQSVYFDSFIKILKGDLIPSGKLPLTISSEFPIGFGLSY